MTIEVLGYAEVELIFLRLCAGSEDANVSCILMTLVFYKCLLQFVVEFEVSCW